MKSQVYNLVFALVVVIGLFLVVPASMYSFNQNDLSPTTSPEMPVVWIDLDVHYFEDNVSEMQFESSDVVILAEDMAQQDYEMSSIDLGALPVSFTPLPMPLSASILDNTSLAVGTPARPRTSLAPVYPIQAQQNGIEGVVVVEFSVDVNGRTFDWVILESSADGVFDDAVLRAIQRWRFTPAADKTGKRVPVRYRQPVRFSLNKK